MKTQPPSVKAAIGAAGLMIIITVACLAYLSQKSIKDAMVSRTQQQLLTIAKTTARSVEDFLTMHSEPLQTIASEALADDRIYPGDAAYLARGTCAHLEIFFKVHHKDLDAIRLFDSSGTLLCRHEPGGEINSLSAGNVDKEPGVAHVLRTKEAYIAKAYYDEPDGLAITVSEPVFQENEFIGIVERVIGMHTLSERFVQPVQLQGGGYAWMFDDNDIVLSHPQKEFVGLGVPDIIEKMHLGHGDVYNGRQLHGHIVDDHDYLNRAKMEDDGVGVFANCTTHEDEVIAYTSINAGVKCWHLVVALPYHEIAGPINEHAQNIFGLAGAVLFLLGIGGAFFIKTEKRKAELETEARYLKELARSAEALREGERRFRNLVENSLTGILIIQDNQVVYKNPEQERLFGPLPDPFRFADLENIHPADGEEFRRFYEKVLSGEIQALDTEVRFYQIDKVESGADVKWVHCRASIIEYQGRDAVLVNMMDITRAKELEHLVLMKQKMVSLGHVAAGIAHEIRNPLSGINIYLTAINRILEDSKHLEGDRMQKVKKIVGQVQSASNKIESVIRRVMDFSKPSQPKLVLTNINEAIDEAITLSSVTLRKSGISLEKSLATHLPQCLADPHLMEQVVLNLITNAAQAMSGAKGDKKIEIASREENNRLVITVSDSGPGVHPNVRDKIFDPFFTTKSDSSGIGLSLSHRIVTDHGGVLNVGESRWGGAEFRVEIPLRKRMDAG